MNENKVKLAVLNTDIEGIASKGTIFTVQDGYYILDEDESVFIEINSRTEKLFTGHEEVEEK